MHQLAIEKKRADEMLPLAPFVKTIEELMEAMRLDDSTHCIAASLPEPSELTGQSDFFRRIMERKWIEKLPAVQLCAVCC